MRSNTWTPGELLANHRVLDSACWRAVEAQHRISTMKLVETRPEQELLESIIESTKPPVPAPLRDYSFLLFTPFRYPAHNPRGSRFRRGGMSEGVFYAAAHPETAIAEMVFVRFLFFAESPDTPLPSNPSEYTIFSTWLRSSAALDLRAEPLLRDRDLWCHPNDYSACQALADAARACGTEIITYESVRDPQHRQNFAVLTERALLSKNVSIAQSWHIHLKPEGAFAACESPSLGVSFRLSDFSADERLANFKPRLA